MYSCPFCFKSCDSTIRLKAHCKLLHSTKLQSVFRCRQTLPTKVLCPRIFSDIYSFLKHLSKTHSRNNTRDDTYFISNTISKTPSKECNISYIDKDITKDVKYTSSSDVTTILSTSHAISNSDETPNISVEKFIEKVTQTSALFVANLYSRPLLPRIFCQEIIDLTKSFFNCVKVIEEKYKSIELNPHPDLSVMFTILNNALSDYSSEYKTMVYFKTLKTFIEPQEICIGAFIDTKVMKAGKQMLVKNQNIYVVPLEKILKTFLELPDVYNKIISNIKENEQKTIITSFLQSKIWHSIKHENDVLPLILYYDELEINNPLGTHRGLHKLGVIYCTIGGMDEQYASMLENIFLIQLHNVTDYIKVGNKQIFAALINQINKRQTDGISINIENSERKIKFALMHILGDNLGLHAIFGLHTSFNSNYSCRMCFVNTSTRQKQILEDVTLLRTIENYTTDVRDKNHGIIEECTFHSIQNFHIIKNPSVDVMHDLFEGVCRYDLGQLLNMLIKKDKLFSLETLNNRIYSFDYGTNHSTNVPPLINIDALNKKYIIYSAAEMACLWQYLGLIIGDLIPNNNKTWKLYIVLRKMMSIIMAREVTDINSSLLRELTSEHHKLYIKLFDDTLKPKHHLLIHYPRIMLQIGPLKQMSSIRFEAKHKELKQTANAITSRKNPAHTLTIKHQLKLNYRFLLNKGFEKRLECSIILHETLTDIDFYSEFKSILPVISFENYKCFSWIKVNGTFYKPNMIIILETNNCKFATIKYIFTNNLCETFFIYKDVRIIQFNTHFYAYEITEMQSWGFIFQSKLETYKAYNIHFVEGKSYVSVL